MMREKYSEKRIVSSYEANANHNLRPAALMDMMQEAAGRDASTLGFGYEEMITANAAWVLSRMKIVFNTYPKWRDEVVLKTWHKGANRIFYLRDFLLEDPQGNNLACATTSWLIIDLSSRRMVRNSTLAENFDSTSLGDAIQDQAEKVAIPKDIEMEHILTHKVVWSDIDTNGHVNNVKYAVWAMDIVDYEDASHKPLREMLINFDAEVLPGQEVELYRTRIEEGSGLVYYVQGKVAGKVCFSIKLDF
jgi:acyl-ACP thioesterase